MGNRVLFFFPKMSRDFSKRRVTALTLDSSYQGLTRQNKGDCDANVEKRFIDASGGAGSHECDFRGHTTSALRAPRQLRLWKLAYVQSGGGGDTLCPSPALIHGPPPS
jgi:hypothetical protein